MHILDQALTAAGHRAASRLPLHLRIFQNKVFNNAADAQSFKQCGGLCLNGHIFNGETRAVKYSCKSLSSSMDRLKSNALQIQVVCELEISRGELIHQRKIFCRGDQIGILLRTAAGY